MKKIKLSKLGILFLVILVSFSVSNCTVHTKPHHHHSHSTKKIPPGQAKKMTGQKSAKSHAPGHNK